MKSMICFKKYGAAKYISHLDLQRTVDRALRRSGVEVIYSEGFNPHIRMSFAFALKVGMESEAEYLEVEMPDGTDMPAAEKAIKASFPDGLDVNWVRKKKDNTKKLMASVAKAEYEAVLEGDVPIDAIEKAITQILSAESLMLTKQTKNGPRAFDARPLIDRILLDSENDRINMLLSAQEIGTLDPRLLMGKLWVVANVDTEYTIIRKNLYLVSGDQAAPLSSLAEF